MAGGLLPSPNFGPRRNGARPSLVVIHYTAMTSCAEARDRLCDPSAEVSAHYLISETGVVEALVAEADRAWHAGRGCWAGIDDVNSHSIGIEMANPGDAPFPERQMAALEVLLTAIMRRWQIRPEAIIAHSDMAPERKRDPGPRFDWRRLALAGVSVWPNGESANGRDLSTSLRAFGYPDLPAAVLLQAFRLRFRPWARGPEEDEDRAMAQDLARRFPVDGVAPKA